MRFMADTRDAAELRVAWPSAPVGRFYGVSPDDPAASSGSLVLLLPDSARLGQGESGCSLIGSSAALRERGLPAELRNAARAAVVLDWIGVQERCRSGRSGRSRKPIAAFHANIRKHEKTP